MTDPTTPAEEALLPCPFCGGPGHLGGLGFVSCGGGQWTCPAFGIEAEKAAWNRRAPRPDALAGAVAALDPFAEVAELMRPRWEDYKRAAIALATIKEMGQ